MKRFRTVNLEDMIVTPLQEETVIDPKKELDAREKGISKREQSTEDRLDRLEFALAEFAKGAGKGIKDGVKDLLPYLQTIAEREYPAFPDIPTVEFPKIQKVRVENPTSVDLSELKELLSQILVKLSEKSPELQPIIIQAPVERQEKEVVEDTAHASQVNVRTRSKARLVPEVPSGAVNGTNATYFLSRAPRYNTQVYVFRNGAYQTPGGVDYTITGNKIVYNTPMQSDRGDGNAEQHYVLIFQS